MDYINSYCCNFTVQSDFNPMGRNWCYLVLLFVLLSLMGCRKTVVPPPAKNMDIYVAGSVSSQSAVKSFLIASYWKNGTITKLTDSTGNADGYAIAIDNGDVYVAGYTTSKTNGSTVATYWRNGKEIHLTDGSTNASASAIMIHNGAVYVTGSVYNSKGIDVATVWKNGVATQLSDGTQNAYVAAIAVSGGDVYLAGADGTSGKIWKNGVATAITYPGSPVVSLSSITVYGSNVYVAGYVKGGGAAYWKDSTPTLLTNTFNSYASSIAVTDNSIYVSGNIDNVGQNEPSIWIDDNPEQWQTSFSSTNFAAGLAVNGQDVYLAGSLGTYAGYWRNGVAVQLASNGSANAIALVVR